LDTILFVPAAPTSPDKNNPVLLPTLRAMVKFLRGANWIKIFLISKFERTLFILIRLFALFWGCSDDAGVDNRYNQLFKGIPKPEQRA
jgi:hypothetical protein